MLGIGGSAGAQTKIDWATQIKNFPVACPAGMAVSRVLGTPTCISVAASGTSADTQVIFNSAGSLTGDASFTYNITAKQLSVPQAVHPMGTLTSAANGFNLTATLNNAAVNFTPFVTNITNTASGAGSLLFDWQVGGVSQFKTDLTGNVTATGGLTGTSVSTTGTGESFIEAANNTTVTPSAANKFRIHALNNVVKVSVNALADVNLGYGHKGYAVGTTPVSATTIAETALMSTAVPSADLLVGSNFHITAWALITTAATPGTITISLRGTTGATTGTVLLTVAGTTLSPSLTNQPMTCNFDVSVVSLGAAGTVEAQGWCHAGLSALGGIAFIGNTGPVTLDTTQTQNFTLTIAFSVTGDTVQQRQQIVSRVSS